MYSKLASMLLVIITIAFFVLHKIEKNKYHLADTVAPLQRSKDLIVHDEFLLLMDQGDERLLHQVLQEFDLKLITPLGEWTHVARNEAIINQRIILADSKEAKESLSFSQTLENHPAIHSVSLNYIDTSDTLFSCAKDSFDDQSPHSHTLMPRDPYFKDQWHLSKDKGVNLVEAWSITTGNKNTLIALVDRNFDFSEFDWSPERCPSRHYYYENILDYFLNPRPSYKSTTTHGSNVLSVLAPCTDNALGLSGIDWHAQIFSVDSKWDASFSARMLGLLWAAGIDVCSSSIIECPNLERFQKNVHKANIINASFGFTGDYLKDPPYGPVLDVIGHINREGRIIVASAGNESVMSDRRLPGSAGGVISVGASNQNHESSYFSNYGKTIDVLAPGENILSLKQGKAVLLNGTSFSSPIVAGITSLMVAANPNLSWKHVEYILKKTADPLGCNNYCPNSMTEGQRNSCRSYCCEGDKVICAAGIVNAYKAVSMAKNNLPNLALIDVDDYYLPLSEDNNLTTTLTIKNWGRKQGIIHMKKSDEHLLMSPKTIKLPPINTDGIPGQGVVTIKYDAIPQSPLVLSLTLQVADLDNPKVFHDQIEAIVEIVPDAVNKKKNKIFREF